MSANGCRNAAPLLSELIDGTLDDARARAVRAHLRSCEACNRQYEETQAIVEAAGSLEPVDPPAALWERVAERLDGDDAAEDRRPGWWWWWQAWRRPLVFGGGALAAAAFALVIVMRDRGQSSSPAERSPEASLPVPPDVQPPGQTERKPDTVHADLYSAALAEVERADGQYQRALGELRDIVKVERARWRPEAARAFDENLAAIEAAVERQRVVVRSKPADVTAVDALHASYRKEIDFLQEAVLRAEGDSL